MKPKIYILSAIIIIGVLFCLCSCAGTMRSEITDAIDTSAVADTDVILDTTVAYDTTGVPDITDALDTTSAPNTTVPKSAVTDSFVTDKVEETSRPAVVTDAPGTWPDPDSIPKADIGHVGKLEKYTPAAKDVLYYHYNKETGFERLVVIEQLLWSGQFGGHILLKIYESDLNGLGGLCDALTSGEELELELAYCANISVYEAMHINFRGDNVHPQEIINVSSPTENPNVLQYYIIGISKDGEIGMIGNMLQSTSWYLQTYINVWNRIFERFSLTDKVYTVGK